MHPILNIATQAAKDAGEFIANQLQNIDRLNIEHKGRNDYVSEVDRQAERIIIDTIHKYYPAHSILAEESGHHHKDSDIEWIIDPLDGTTNFLHQFPQFAVSIAVTEKGKLMHGVIYDPLRDELFSASRGQGARVNNYRIRVSNQNTLADALMATGIPYYNFDYVDAYLESFKEFMISTAGIRRPGSAALDLAYVASGRVDGYWELNLKPWDIAAGALIVQEAGGMITDFMGGDGYLQSGNIIAANPKMLKEMASVIGRTIPEEFRRNRPAQANPK
ncbi:MAG: inositol monophosphatase family protein [Hydrogenovibrio sp.]|uniref:inositol monophosphatase family protein n=1 Tax=Hydrogenovibrio TaxID=28884 RepID=UPI0003712983|nr:MULTISPECIES: inositol monophosphatase family protein [Hydrogenovibrio]MDR9498963.1 inositol monophosphatase family protein [Hydrogenovibrio sp.]